MDGRRSEIAVKTPKIRRGGKRLEETAGIDGIDGIDGLFITEVLVITLFIVVMICCVFTFLNPSEIDDGNLGFTTPAVRLRFQSAHWLIQSWPEEGLALVTVKGKFPGKHVFLLCKDEGSSKFPYMCMRLSYCACLYIYNITYELHTYVFERHLLLG